MALSDWAQLTSINAMEWTCGYCGNNVAGSQGVPGGVSDRNVPRASVPRLFESVVLGRRPHASRPTVWSRNPWPPR